MFTVLYIFLQIVLESFPISSSGHVYFFQKFYCLADSNCDVNLIPVWFDHLLHIPTVLVILLYFSNYFRYYITLIYLRSYKIVKVIKAVFISDSITVAFYILRKYTSVYLPLECGFLVTACLLYSLRFVKNRIPLKTIENLSVITMISIGFAQGISFLPGISRFGTTYVVGRWMGLGGMDSFFYSFLLALPLFGAAGLKAVIECYKASELLSSLISLPTLAVSIVLATIFSYYSFIIVGSLIRRHKLWYISYYMFVVTALATLSSWFT